MSILSGLTQIKIEEKGRLRRGNTRSHTSMRAQKFGTITTI